MRKEINVVTGEITEHPDDVVNYVPTPAELNAPIFAKLKEIDAKSIRALREGNAERIASLEAEAVSLRSQLV